MTEPETTPKPTGRYTTVAALAALSTAGCRVDVGPVPGCSYAPCDSGEPCAAPGTVHIVWEDCAALVDAHREGDWCPAHARCVVLDARERATYVDVECRSAATVTAEVAA